MPARQRRGTGPKSKDERYGTLAGIAVPLTLRERIGMKGTPVRQEVPLPFPSYRRASIEELLERCTPAVRRLVQAARQKILAAVPGATERLRAGWGIVGYDAPGYFAFVAPMEDHVRIGFERGVLLPDPAGILEGEGTQVRHVVVRRVGDLRSAELTALLREAAAMRAPRSAQGGGPRPKRAGGQGRASRAAPRRGAARSR